MQRHLATIYVVILDYLTTVHTVLRALCCTGIKQGLDGMNRCAFGDAAKAKPCAASQELLGMRAMLNTVVKPGWQEQLPTAQRQASYRCASAILGGRFPDLQSALCHPEYQEALPRLVNETLATLRKSDLVTNAAKQMEKDRRQKDVETFVKSTGKDGMSLRQDLAWLE